MKEWMLKKLLRYYLYKTIQQGNAYHQSWFYELFNEIQNKMQKTFYEDSETGIKQYMKECIDKLNCNYR